MQLLALLFFCALQLRINVSSVHECNFLQFLLLELTFLFTSRVQEISSKSHEKYHRKNLLYAAQRYP